ncbi:MAG: hypothetical protein U1E27_09405, partial [Kiritimatiellia bacterium]|nr:hypothetical protein [Kiritimatiellia bacterium]
VASLVEVVDKLDIMLAQVLIEAVILEINLSDSLAYGLDWLQRSMSIYNTGRSGPGGGALTGEKTVGFGGGFAAAAQPGFLDGSLIDRNVPLSNAGLTYYLTFFNLNLDAILRLAAKSGDARVLSTPVIMTTDNTEASIISSEQRPVVTQTSTTTGGEIRSSYEYRDIGIKLTVKPRINPERYVVLDVTQTADTPGEEVRIDNNLVPRIFRRELKASIAVPHRGTVALGGLIQTDSKQTRSKIPILGDIPLIGWLFRGEDRSNARTELLVLITPYVITTPEEARKETRRLHDGSSVSGTDWASDWADGDLAAEKRAEAREPISLRGRGAGISPAPPKEPVPVESPAPEAPQVEGPPQLMPWVQEALEAAP